MWFPRAGRAVLAQGLEQGWVWVQEKGLEAGKAQPGVSIAAFLIPAHPWGSCPPSSLPCQLHRQPGARLVPSSAAAPVQSSKALDALSSVSAPKPT